MNAIVDISKLTTRLLSVIFFLSGLEELIRKDAGASELAGFLLIIAGVVFAFASRTMRVNQNKTPVPLSSFLRGNQVLTLVLEKRLGQIGMAIFATGAVSSVLGAAMLRWNIYSIVLFLGFGIIIVGLIWMLGMTVMAALEILRGTATGRK